MIIILTNLLSLACLGWALSGADLHRIWGETRHMQWGWVWIAALSNVAVFLIQGWRWQLVLRPVQRVSYSCAIEAIYVGLFANEILPLRAGELIRCFLLSKSTRIPLSVTLASALIERIFDGVWLMACFLYCLHIAKLPRALIDGGYGLGAMILVCGIILAYAMYAKTQSLTLFDRWPRWFHILIEDLHLIGHSRYLYLAFLASGAFMLSQMAPLYALLIAGRMSLPWTASFILMVLLRLSSIVPQAPGNLGSFQWVTAETLHKMFGLGLGHAKRFSLILWAVVTLPIVIAGCIALAATGVTMSHLHREAKAAAKDRRKPARHTA